MERTISTLIHHEIEITVTSVLQNYSAYEDYLDKYPRSVYNSVQHLNICYLPLIVFPIHLKIKYIFIITIIII